MSGRGSAGAGQRASTGNRASAGERANGREAILQRVRSALAGRDRTPHPGDFVGSRPSVPDPDPVACFESIFTAAGGEVVHCTDQGDAARWLSGFEEAFDSVTLGRTVPRALHPSLPETDAADAALAVSMASAGIGETGSVALDARDGRRTQLLAATHVVFLHASKVFATLRDALLTMKGDLPSAIGLHSGPSKSADIGQILVRGVHGPGRIVVVVIEGP